MKTMTIKDLRCGDFFKLKPTGKVYVRGEYNRSTKRFEYYDFNDVNNYHEAKRCKVVIPDSEFEF